MASQQSQPPVLWSELPPEILGLILSHLGKHDLLNARSVSQAWNEESLKVLGKSEFTQVLTERKMMEYILFTTSIERRPLIIPFHLNFKYYFKLLPSGTTGLITLSSYVQNLCQLFGPQCVSKLTLTPNEANNVYTEEYGKERSLTEFLTLISPGLKTLDFTRFAFGHDFLENQTITFPSLTKLICNIPEYEYRGRGSSHAYISIIENSPKLEDLTLTNSCDLESWPLNFNQLKSLSIMGPMINPQNILNKILASSGPPVLRELRLRDHESLSERAQYDIVVYNILKSVSTTLKSLRVREAVVASNRPMPTPRVMRFPKLPHLEHLGLEYNVGYKWHLDPEAINLSEDTFPSLKSIELPIGFMFTSLPVQYQGDDCVRIKFPNVTNLILRLRYHSANNPTAGPADHLLNGTLEHLQEIFPTPSKLSFVNVGGNDCVKYVLDRIVKSNWSINIQEIGMIGFTQDYLGQVMGRLEFRPRLVLENCNGMSEEPFKREFQNVMRIMRMECEETVVSPGQTILTRANESDSIKMTNITKIKLDLSVDCYHLNSRYLQLSRSPSMPIPMPSFFAIGKYFPQLKMIEISDLFLQHLDKSLWRKHILEFKSQFPQVNIYLT